MRLSSYAEEAALASDLHYYSLDRPFLFIVRLKLHLPNLSEIIT